MANNMVNMAQQGDTKGMEEVIRNTGKEKGIDVDAQFSNFVNMLRGMGFKL